jgi:hypothetical protein
MIVGEKIKLKVYVNQHDSVSFSYPEPFLRAVRRGALAHRYNRPRLLTAMIESVTCRSKSKMAAIQGKNIRSGIGKTLFF